MNTPSIGQPLVRVDGKLKVTGAARYAAEFNQPHQAYAVIVSAGVGLGRIARIETAGVASMPGVIAVISHLNALRLPYKAHKGQIDPAFGERLHVLQDAQVRFYGQPVAVIVADTLDHAEHAAASLRVEYEAQTPVVRSEETSSIKPQVGARAGGRIVADGARGDADAALAEATVKVDEAYITPRQNHNPMEPHATVAAWEGDRLTLWSKSQFVMNEAAEVAAVFDIPADHVTVISPFVGGAFGTTLRTWSHVTLAALAARQSGRPVKLVLSRRQMFYATGHRPRTVQRVALAANRDGQLTAVIHEATGDTSRYEEFAEATTSAASLLYSCPNVRTRYRLAPLDISTPNHMRGPGEASGLFALETAIDELACALGVDPIQLRLRNEPSIDENTRRPFSSRSLRQCYETGAERFGWSKRHAQPRSMRDGRWLIGWGVASATYPAHQGRASARVRLLPDGTAEVEAAASDMGPGTYTSMTQVAADALGIEPSKVRFSLGRSDFPPVPPHGGSQTMASVGSAIQAAARAALEQFERSGTRPVEASATTSRGEAGGKYSMHSFGAMFAEVGVDTDLGIVRVRRALGVYAAGKIINPKLAASQCIGGIVGGISLALMEQTVLDTRDGRPVNASMADYLVPVNLDIGEIDVAFVDEVDPHVSPLGAKGLGEIVMVGVAPAIGNAVFHATGRRVRELPLREIWD